MNPAQLATDNEAKGIAKLLAGVGLNVTRTYVPTYGGPYTPPSIGSAQFLHFRFENGADGFNVGLVRRTITCFPTRWPAMIGQEVHDAANQPDPWE